MRLRPRRRTLVAWSSSAVPAIRSSAVPAIRSSAVPAIRSSAVPAIRSGRLGRPRGGRPGRVRRISWWLRIGALLAVIGILRLTRTARSRWEPLSLLAGALLMVTGFALPAVAGAYLLGLLVLIAVLLKGIKTQSRNPAR